MSKKVDNYGLILQWEDRLIVVSDSDFIAGNCLTLFYKILTFNNPEVCDSKLIAGNCLSLYHNPEKEGFG